MSITFRLMLSLCFSMNSVEPEFVIGFPYLVFVSMLVQMAGHTATLLNTSLNVALPCHAMSCHACLTEHVILCASPVPSIIQ